jgi:hypothetical protein
MGKTRRETRIIADRRMPIVRTAPAFVRVGATCGG